MEEKKQVQPLSGELQWSVNNPKSITDACIGFYHAGPKLLACSSQDAKNKILDQLEKMFMLMGVGADRLPDHETTAQLVNHIRLTFGQVYHEEINFAFNLGLARLLDPSGRLMEPFIYNRVNWVSISAMMFSYLQFRARKLQASGIGLKGKPKEKTEEEKEKAYKASQKELKEYLISTYNLLLKDETYDRFAFPEFYLIIEEVNLKKFSPDEKWAAMADAVEILQAMEMNKKLRPKSGWTELVEGIAERRNKGNVREQRKAKTILVDSFLIALKNSNIKLEEFKEAVFEVSKIVQCSRCSFYSPESVVNVEKDPLCETCINL